MAGISTNRDKGVTLIEVMVAILLLLVAVVGVINFRFFCAMDARKADVHINATRLGLTLLEGWRGAGGNNSFDPEFLETAEMVINPGSGPAPASDLTLLGKYQVILRGVNYYATLSYKDDAAGMVNESLRNLNVIVHWPKQYPDGAYVDGDGRSIRMTTYAY